MEARRRAYLALSLTAGLGPITLRRAVSAAFGVLGLLKFSHAAWGEVESIGSVKAAQIIRDLPRARAEAEQVADRCAEAGIGIVTLEDEAYPALMRDLADAPTVLYVRGQLEPRDLNAVAIVGARQCSFYGRDQATRFAGLLAGAGVTVVSGGARGVDSAGHEGALRVAGGRTIAVLGCGVDVAYPPEHEELFAKIAGSGQGALVSHFPPGTPPNQRHFPERNRVISALSRAVFVIEADERSGSLITARIAADDHDRPVLALPGRVDNPLSAGPHKLLKDGAVLVSSLEDILDNLGPLPESTFQVRRHEPLASDVSPPERTSGPQEVLEFAAPKKKKATGNTITSPNAGGSVSRPDLSQTSPDAAGSEPRPYTNLTTEQQAIVAAMRGQAESQVETLIDATNLPAATILRELTLLSLKGQVRRLDAQTYALRKA